MTAMAIWFPMPIITRETNTSTDSSGAASRSCSCLCNIDRFLIIKSHKRKYKMNLACASCISSYSLSSWETKKSSFNWFLYLVNPKLKAHNNQNLSKRSLNRRMRMVFHLRAVRRESIEKCHMKRLSYTIWRIMRWRDWSHAYKGTVIPASLSEASIGSWKTM